MQQSKVKYSQTCPDCHAEAVFQLTNVSSSCGQSDATKLTKTKSKIINDRIIVDVENNKFERYEPFLYHEL